MSYRMIKYQPTHLNSLRSKVLRSMYSQEILKALDADKRLINIDESWIDELTPKKKRYFLPGAPSTIATRKMGNHTSVIAAIDTNGNSYFTVLHGNVDSDVFSLFVTWLVKILDVEDVNW